MGDGAEPDGYRGFGRIHLAMGMPLGGEGSLALFVADSANYRITDGDVHDFAFDVDASAGLDFRATLSWIDPPTSVYSAVQLVNNLDLSVVSPSGTTLTMWSSGRADTVNVNERVTVDSADVESGTYTVQVAANGLTTDTQKYSLVVNGAISPLAASSESPFAPAADSSSRQSGSDGDGSGSPADAAGSSSGAMTTQSSPVSLLAHLLGGAVVSAIAAACTTV